MQSLPDLTTRAHLFQLAPDREIPSPAGPCGEMLNAVDMRGPGFEGPHGIRVDGSEDLVTGPELNRWLLDEARNAHPRIR